MSIAELAKTLEQARLHHEPTEQVTNTASLTLDEAYQVQAAAVSLQLTASNHVSGVKLGFTSEAKARQMGVSDVILGVLVSDSEVSAGEVLDTDRLIHPRVEAEIAFRVHSDITKASHPRDCVDAVAPALEVIDSRYKDFRFSVEDVVADNTSAAAYTVGPWTSIEDLSVDLDTAHVELVIGSDTVAAGVGSDILGNPWEALDAAARLATEHGQRIEAGSVILAGAATQAVPLPSPGTVTARISGLGEAILQTSGGTR